MRPEGKKVHIWHRVNELVTALDRLSLWWVGLLLFCIVFIPLFILGEDCVFPIHDQLDETIMCYVLNARHMGTGDTVFPELLGGINTSGMQPSAMLFVLLYRLFPALTAFLLQYAVVFLFGFLGMYLAVKETTGSSIVAVAMGGCFCMLPIPPIYGLSVIGVPFLLWCFINLWKQKRIVCSFLFLLFFGLTTHLVLIGYVVLGFWLLAILWALKKKCCNRWLCLGFGTLMLIYVTVNRDLFFELIFRSGSYVSHRKELVNGALPFWDTAKNLFFNSAQHADSLHKYLIFPVFAALILRVFFYRQMDGKCRKRLLAATAGMGILAGIAVLYGFCKWQPVVDFKNNCNGFLRYFQLERFYWLYPAGWYLEFGLCFSLWWRCGTEKEDEGAGVEVGETVERAKSGEKKRTTEWIRIVLCSPLFQLVVLVLVLLPTLQLIKVNSYFYMNVNQYNNGSGVTGYIPWKSFYAEELMQELENAIGRNKEEYRVAHLGISPAPALMHGFYTTDGYSNNYPLEYKHRFRRVIEKELKISPETAGYFDTWGSRCYLFNSETGSLWMLGKQHQIVYKSLDFDITALAELGCEYIFSCGVIQNAEKLDLELLGYFETEDSYWGIWLYALPQAS
ncbi:MAG: hypothetical protein HDQ96_09405 [Lachnospiraceae bacterium]|nr:hypothetical protein [Lachnospiraceae bacterium]